MAKSKDILINGQIVKKGEKAVIDIPVARLPSGTMINIPVHVYRGEEDGPRLLLLAGLHGDEINGVETIRRMIKSSWVVPKKGSVICIPILNIFGFINYAREVPDGKDVNRSFPGSPRGSLAGRVAHMFMKEIFPNIDYGLDFHTGGKSRANYPQIRCLTSYKENLDLAKAFGAPIILNSKLRDQSLRKSATLLGKPILVFEGGESHRFDELSIKTGIDGAKRVMQLLQMRDFGLSSPSSLLLSSSSWIRAKRSGLFRSKIQLGDHIKKNQVIGYICDVFGQDEIVMKTRKDGVVIGLNNNPVVSQGDALVHLGIVDVKNDL